MRILAQTNQHPRALEQLQVMGERGGISRFGQLADHFLVREYLPRVGATQLKQAAEQGGFIHPRQKQDVPRNGGVNQGIQNDNLLNNLSKFTQVP